MAHRRTLRRKVRHRRQQRQQSVAHKRADHLGHNVHDGQRPADRSVNDGAQSHCRIQMSTGHIAETLNDHHHRQPKAEAANVVAARRVPRQARAAADEQQNRGADQFGEELRDHLDGTDAKA